MRKLLAPVTKMYLNILCREQHWCWDLQKYLQRWAQVYWKKIEAKLFPIAIQADVSWSLPSLVSKYVRLSPEALGLK